MHSSDEDSRPTRSEEPEDRLGRLAEAMSKALEAHPEYHDERAIVMLDSDSEMRRLTHVFGFDDDSEAVIEMFLHLRAIVRAGGRDIDFIGIPDDVSEIDDEQH